MLLSDQIRQVIKDSGRARSELCEAIGVDATVLSRFLNGHCGLAMDKLDRLGRFLDLRIIRGQGRKKAKA